MKQYEGTIRQARQTNLVEWLLENNEPLKRIGKWWYIEGNDSLRIQDNKWYRNSRGIGGNTIDFLVDYYNMSPKEAIFKLTQHAGCDENKNSCIREEKIKTSRSDSIGFNELDFNITKAEDQRRVLAYLIKTRGIASDIVLSEIHRGKLFQESDTGNAVFVMSNESGDIVGAEVAGTISLSNNRYKGIKAGSASGYGYTFGQKQNPRYILFFESAIDLISFVTVKRKQGKSMEACLLISMAGLKLNVVQESLKVYGNASAIPVLCVDNDKAGDMFIDRCLDIFPLAILKKPDKCFKDWNDQLVSG